MLYWFRKRAGVATPAGSTSWGWDGHSDSADAYQSMLPAASTEHCNTGGDPTYTVNGQWKDSAEVVFTFDPPTAGGAFTAHGPGWPGTLAGRVFINGSFWLDFPPAAGSDADEPHAAAAAAAAGHRATGMFSNTSSWKKLCWWTALSWADPPPGGESGERWCKLGSPGCTKPPHVSPPPPAPDGVPDGRNVDGPDGLRGRCGCTADSASHERSPKHRMSQPAVSVAVMCVAWPGRS